MMSRYQHRLLALLEGLVVAIALAFTSAGWQPMGAVAAVDSPVTIMAAGDIAEGGTSSMANATATGDLIRAANPDAVLTLGDNAYPDGSPSDFATKYDPTWGSFKEKTYPTPGNHDYHSDPPAGYLGYFGTAKVTNSADGGIYYAWDVGNGWRAYAVNTEISTSGAQLTWLQNDVAAHPGMHYILYTHRPRYTSGNVHSPSTSICPLWNALASTGGLEIVLAGHQHDYERFAKMNCAGQESPTGARSFVAGSGGNQLYAFGTPQPGSQFRNATDYGVLKLVLHTASYDWSFIASGRGWNGSTSIDTNNAGQVLDTGSQVTNGAPTPGNLAPSVDAGVDQMVTLPGSLSLDATVTDDGLPNPPATVTTSWSKLTGPGTVTFTNAATVDTTASFSQAGSYTLQLSADDSAATTSDTVTVTVQPAGGGGARTIEARVAAGSDDAEEPVSGSMYVTSSDLELTTDGSTQQVVGTRFAAVQIPTAATVTSAYVQFQVDEVSTGASSMTIRAENSDNAATYTSGSATISARPVTGGVPWTPADWPTINVAGPDQRTPDISSLVQAVVNRTGWVTGNAVALQFSGTGRRTAEAFEGSTTGAPLLHLEYTTGGVTNVAPVVNAGADQVVTLPGSLSLDASVTDDGLPNPPGAVTTSWSKLTGPGTVAFGNVAAVDTTASFSQAGSYVLQLSADDSAATTSDTVIVTVQPAGGGTRTIEVRVAARSDDAEQRVGGQTTLNDSRLELTTDGKRQQVVGTRFAGVQIPRGATVTSAYVQFQVDGVSTGASSMTIRAENSDNAATYTSGSGTITARAVTGGVTWTPPGWPTVNVAGPDQRTPDISSLVQAVVNRTGWVAGNAVALQFSGTGRRSAEAFEGSTTGAPLLHLEYTTGG